MALSDFFNENEAETFAKLRGDGWIDVSHPKNSKLLALVNRQAEDSKEAIRVVRERERTALTEWLVAAVTKPELLSHKSDTKVGLELDEALIRHLRTDQVLARFNDNIWSEMGRCINCHSPDKNERLVKEHGDQMSWIVPHDPEATLIYLRENGLIDFDNPAQSQLRTKPAGLIKHGGGPKFAVGSASDKRFLSFLIDFAKVVEGKYKSAKELPTPISERTQPTEYFLRLTNLPDDWSEKLLRVDLYTKSEDGSPQNRVATADGPVNGKQHQWQSPLWTVQSNNVTRIESLASGNYVARISVDHSHRMSADPQTDFLETDLSAHASVTGPWQLGWKEPMVVDRLEITRLK